MILLAKSDFTGFFTLIRSTANDPLLQSYIDRYEREYILKLLGVEFGQDFIANIAGTPSAENIVIRDAFYEQDDSDTIWISQGIKEYLKAAVFYEYIFHEQVQHSQSGVILSQAETSNVVSPDNAARFAEQRWNSALETAEAIQWKCKTDAPDDYPDYNGTTLRPRYSALL